MEYAISQAFNVLLSEITGNWAKILSSKTFDLLRNLLSKSYIYFLWFAYVLYFFVFILSSFCLTGNVVSNTDVSVSF